MDLSHQEPEPGIDVRAALLLTSMSCGPRASQCPASNLTSLLQGRLRSIDSANPGLPGGPIKYTKGHRAFSIFLLKLCRRCVALSTTTKLLGKIVGLIPDDRFGETYYVCVAVGRGNRLFEAERSLGAL